MKTHEDVITKMNNLVNRYHTMKVIDGNELAMILKDFVSALYYLETVRAETHDKFQKRVKELIAEGNTVSRSENLAHVEHPDMYRLRRVMDAGYEVVGAIRSNISFLKHEQTLEQ